MTKQDREKTAKQYQIEDRRQQVAILVIQLIGASTSRHFSSLLILYI
jgi:hypothetical protein